MTKIKQMDCSRRLVLLTIAGAVAQLAGCGGGTNVSGLSSGGTGSFTTGTITGFGSIIVNGIRYDDTIATVLSQDDETSSSQNLQLGMVVNIEGSSLTPSATATGLPTATAHRITYGSEWAGPVSQVNVGSSSFEVLGNRVDVLSTTLFSTGDISTLTSAQFVEIYGYVDPTDGHIQASRVEVSTTQSSVFKLSGAITQINRANRTAIVGNTAIAWGTSVVLPDATQDRSFVRVALASTPAGTTWTATKIGLPASPLTNLSRDQDYEAEVHGTITAYTSNASFIVNGIPVNAASVSPAPQLSAGLRVEVKGAIRQGQLMASAVEVKNKQQIEAEEFEFYGLVSNVDTTARTFDLRGQTFDYDNQTEHLEILSLNPPPYVEVKASRAGGRWHAFEIDRED